MNDELQYERTKKGMVTVMYSTQRTSSRQRGHAMPKYGKEWFRDWLFNQDKFHALYDKWLKSGFKTALKPSVDRRKNSIGYTKDNIRLTIWADNKSRGHKDKRNSSSQAKPVLGLDMQTWEVKEYISVSEASRATGANVKSVSSACNSRSRSAGGYLWKFKNL